MARPTMRWALRLSSPWRRHSSSHTSVLAVSGSAAARARASVSKVAWTRTERTSRSDDDAETSISGTSWYATVRLSG